MRFNIFLIVTMVLLTGALLADSINANTPAVEKQNTWQDFLNNDIFPMIWNFLKVLLGTVLTFLSTYIYEAIRKWLATTRYGQELGILMEAVKKSVSRKAKEKGVHYQEMLKDLHRIVSDFKIASEEKEELMVMRNEIIKDAIEIAREDLKELRGHISDKAGKYLAERIDLLLGELESQVADFLLNSNRGGSENLAPVE